MNKIKQFIISLVEFKNTVTDYIEYNIAEIEKLKNEIKKLKKLNDKINLNEYIEEQMKINPLIFMIEALNNNIASEKEKDSKYIGPFDSFSFNYCYFPPSMEIIRCHLLNLVNSTSEKEAFHHLKNLKGKLNSETSEMIAKLATNDFQYKIITNLLKYPT